MALVINSTDVPPKVLSERSQRRTVTGEKLMITRYEARAGAEFEAHSRFAAGRRTYQKLVRRGFDS